MTYIEKELQVGRTYTSKKTGETKISEKRISITGDDIDKFETNKAIILTTKENEELQNKIKELEKLKDGYSSNVREIEKQYANQLQRKEKELIESYKTKENNLSDTYERKEKEIEKQLTDLNNKHDTELKKLQQSIADKDKKLKEFDKKINQLNSEIEILKHDKDQLQNIINQKDATIKKFETSVADATSDKEILKDTNRDLTIQHSENISKLDAEYNTKVAELEKAHEKTIGELNTNHAREIGELNNKHQKEINMKENTFIFERVMNDKALDSTFKELEDVPRLRYLFSFKNPTKVIIDKHKKENPLKLELPRKTFDTIEKLE